MTNREIAAVLFNTAAILDAQRGNPYRIDAYRRAARNILRLPHRLADRVAAGEPLGVPRLGERLTAKIGAMARGETLPFYEELCETLTAAEQALLTVPGIGPQLAAQVRRSLGASDALTLRRAAANGTLRRVYGIGPRRAEAVIRTLGVPQPRQERLAI